ncbi:MAG TPA: DUF6541 family protein [Chloroflexia bacterium]|nr:DUF6541 family protein [Chloroflexia bacterium]
MFTAIELAGWLPLVLLGTGLLLVPGLAVGGLLAAGAGRRDPALGAPDGALGRLLDALGLSLALWPLILLYGTLLQIPFSPWTIGIILSLGAGIALGLWLRGGRGRAGLRLLSHPLTLLTLGTLMIRFLAVHYLAVPQWGDSLHHTLITQLFLEQRGVPHGYRPYAPVDSFSYHFGFHGLAALWAWLSGQTAWSAVISVGQILNALAVPAAYVLTRELFRSRAAGLASAVLVGFFSSMPAAYVDWGRYTQLAGQVLLPFALVWFLRWVEAPAWPRLALAGLGAAGLGLTHDRILIFYALFVLAYLGVRGLHILTRRGSRPGARWSRLAPVLGRAIAVAVVGGVLFAPWLGNLLANYLPGLFHRLDTVTPSYLDEYAGWAFLTQYLGLALPALALLGVLVTGIGGPGRARLLAATLVVWTGLLVVAAKPDAFHLPGGGAIGTFTVGIALYLPLSTLAGPALARPLLAALLAARRRWGARTSGWWRTPAALRRLPGWLALLTAALLAVVRPAGTTDPHFAYVTPDDLAAIIWAGGHTPPGAHFLISAQSTYQGRAITATDAGMWLPLLAGGGRAVSVPPLSTGAEGRQAADLARRTAALYQAGRQPTAPASLAVLRREHIGYVFVGEQAPTISTTLLLRDPGDYCLLYQQGRSYIFGVQAICRR